MVILLHILQEAAFTCRYLVVTEMKTWIRRTIRMKMVDIRQEAVRRDRDLAMGRLRASQPFRWSTMKSRLLLEVLLMLLGLRRNMQIRTRCSVRLCRGRHHLHRLFLFLFLLILIFRFLKVLDRHRQGMCHRLVLVVSTQMIRPRRSRGLCGTAGGVVTWSVGWEEGSPFYG